MDQKTSNYELLVFNVINCISFLAKSLYGKDVGPEKPLETMRVEPDFSYKP